MSDALQGYDASHGTASTKDDKLPGLFLSRQFFTDGKILTLQHRYGTLAPLALIELWLAIAGEKDCRLLSDAGLAIVSRHWKGMSENVRDKNAETKIVESEKCIQSFVEFLIEIELLQVEKKGKLEYITNEKIKEDTQRLKAKRKNWRLKNKKHLSNDGEYSEYTRSNDGECEEYDASTLNTAHRTLNTEYRTHKKGEEREEGAKKPRAAKISIEGKTHHPPHVWLSDIEREAFIVTHGEPFVSRAIEKLNAWIDLDPIPKRIKNGRNAAACFRSWVFNAVAEEQSRAERNGHGANRKETQAEKEARIARM